MPATRGRSLPPPWTPRLAFLCSYFLGFELSRKRKNEIRSRRHYEQLTGEAIETLDQRLTPESGGRTSTEQDSVIALANTPRPRPADRRHQLSATRPTESPTPHERPVNRRRHRRRRHDTHAATADDQTPRQRRQRAAMFQTARTAGPEARQTLAVGSNAQIGRASCRERV